MSFFSTLGKIGKGVGKLALGAVGTATGVQGLSTMFDSNKSPSSSPVPYDSRSGVAASLNLGGASYDSQNAGGGSLLNSVKGFLNSASGVLSGKSHIQTDVHTEIGGTANGKMGGLPSWILPVGIGAALLLFLSGGGRRRR